MLQTQVVLVLPLELSVGLKEGPVNLVNRKVQRAEVIVTSVKHNLSAKSKESCKQVKSFGGS